MKKILLSLIAGLIVIGATMFSVQFLPSYNVKPSETSATPTETTPSSPTTGNQEPANANHPAEWVTTTLLNAGVNVTVNLPPDARLFEGSTNRWMLSDAYLEKSRTMKTIVLDATSQYDLDHCLVSDDMSSVISETDATFDGVKFCKVIGTDVGAGQVYRTMLFASKESSVPLAIAFTIHYASSVQLYAGCELVADLTKPECIARQFHDDDMKLFTNIMGTFKMVK